MKRIKYYYRKTSSFLLARAKRYTYIKLQKNKYCTYERNVN